MVMQLRKRELSYGEIIEIIGRSKGVKLNSSHISYWVRGVKHPLGNVNKFYAKPSSALAYILGVKASDGYVYKSAKAHNYGFELKSIDYEYNKVTGKNIAKVLRRRTPYVPWWNKDDHLWYVKCYSVLLYRFLLEPLEHTKPFIEHCKRCVAAFLKAFFDGEGSVGGRRLTVHNSSRQILLYVQYLLRRYFSIETTGLRKGSKPGTFKRNGKTYRHNKQMYYLHIRARSLGLFQRFIGFTIERKKRRLSEAISRWVSSPLFLL